MHRQNFDLARARDEELGRRAGRPDQLHASELRRNGRTLLRRRRER